MIQNDINGKSICWYLTAFKKSHIFVPLLVSAIENCSLCKTFLYILSRSKLIAKWSKFTCNEHVGYYIKGCSKYFADFLGQTIFKVCKQEHDCIIKIATAK